MPDIRYIDKDFVELRYKSGSGKKRKATLTFGDKIDFLGVDGSRSKIRALELFDGTLEGTVKGEPFRDRTKGVLRLSMVDVQQGDGLILETPPDANDERQVIFIDGGENKLFARHAAARFRHKKTSAANPLKVALMLVTHGDGDHFDGLNDLRRSETQSGLAERKRLFVQPERVYHSGLVKAPTKDPGTGKKRKQEKFFGKTVSHDGGLAIVDLFDDPRDAGDLMSNQYFDSWKTSLDHWESRAPIEFRRVAFGMDESALFGFLGPQLKVELLGPFTVEVDDGAQTRDALPFLHSPKKSAAIHLEEGTPDTSALSASHTINGHSIAFRLTYGNVRFNFTGDLNQEGMALMRQKLPDLDVLAAEILKTPHHGSADFDMQALKKVKPVVSLISSGDENAFFEHIHPRATLVSALGRAARDDQAIVLCTELAAFFEKRDYAHTRAALGDFFPNDAAKSFKSKALRKLFRKKKRTKAEEKALKSFFSFERTNFGIIHIRTDGERLLVFTHSGKAGLREAYRYTVDAGHQVELADDVETG